MKPTSYIFLKLVVVIATLSLLSSCSIGNKFATRKYTKGYYVDFVSKQKTEPRITRNENPTTQTIPVKQEPKPIVPVVSHSANTVIKTPHPMGGKQYLFLAKLVRKQDEFVSVLEKPLFANTLQLPSDTIPTKRSKSDKITGGILIGFGIILELIGLFGDGGGFLLLLGIVLMLCGIPLMLAPAKSPFKSSAVKQTDSKVRPRQIIAFIASILGSILLVCSSIFFLSEYEFLFYDVGLLLSIIGVILGIIGLNNDDEVKEGYDIFAIGIPIVIFLILLASLPPQGP